MDQPPILRLKRPAASTWLGYSDSSARIWFYGAILVLGLAAAMRMGEDRHVYLPGLATPVFETCFARRHFGVDCPGCGLTRTFIYLMHGDFTQAVRLNAVGILVFLFTVLQIPLGFCQLCLHRRGPYMSAWYVWNERWIAVFAFALVLQWLIRNSLGTGS